MVSREANNRHLHTRHHRVEGFEVFPFYTWRVNFSKIHVWNRVPSTLQRIVDVSKFFSDFTISVIWTDLSGFWPNISIITVLIPSTLWCLVCKCLLLASLDTIIPKFFPWPPEYRNNRITGNWPNLSYRYSAERFREIHASRIKRENFKSFKSSSGKYCFRTLRSPFCKIIRRMLSWP